MQRRERGTPNEGTAFKREDRWAATKSQRARNTRGGVTGASRRDQSEGAASNALWQRHDADRSVHRAQADGNATAAQAGASTSGRIGRQQGHRQIGMEVAIE